MTIFFFPRNPTFNVQCRSTYSPGDPSGRAKSYFYYKEVEEESLEEYVLFDFNAILAAVGGSIGLFLGFSFLDCVIATKNRILALCCKKCIKQR